MIEWHNANETPPPKDRVIAVTNGFCWHHKHVLHPGVFSGAPVKKRSSPVGDRSQGLFNNYPNDAGRKPPPEGAKIDRPEQTSRTWSLHGMIILAVWTGKFFAPASCASASPDAAVPSFAFWADIANPLAEATPEGMSPFQVEMKLPSGVGSHLFPGMAFRSEAIAELRRNIDERRKSIVWMQDDPKAAFLIRRAEAAILAYERDIEALENNDAYDAPLP